MATRIKAVVLDLVGYAMDWLNAFGNEDNLELCEIITLDESSPIPLWELNNYDNWDYLLVFENGVNERVRHLLEHIGIDEKRVIYPLGDVGGSLYEHRFISSYIFREYIGKMLDYYSHRKDGEKYAMVSVEDMSYINVSSDNVILPEMIRTEKNWAYDDLKLFHRLSHEYFEFDDTQDIFCDIGANIGTTCIYFKEKLDRDVCIMAFEPSSENYKLLKVNFMLNNIEIVDHMLVNKGLSDKKSVAELSYTPYNPGASSLLAYGSDAKEMVELVSFDEYLEENNVDAARLKYLWIDVEGYEARFLAGANKTLDCINVPVFIEFIPRFYMGKEGEFDLLMSELKKHFQYFICKDELDKGKQSIDRLRKEQNNFELMWDLFLFKR